MIWPLLTGLWRLVVSLPFWWLYLVKHSPMHGLCHCLELFINSMWWVYKVHSFHQDILLIATSNTRSARSQFSAIFCQAKVHRFSLHWITAALSCLSLLKKMLLFEGRAVLYQSQVAPGALLFFLGNWEIISQVQSSHSGLSTIFPRVQPFSCLKRAVECQAGKLGVVYLLSVLGCSV